MQNILLFSFFLLPAPTLTHTGAHSLRLLSLSLSLSHSLGSALSFAPSYDPLARTGAAG